MSTKWAAPFTYGASKYEVQTDETHARQVAVVVNIDDAYLIAAAPDLLEACKELIAYCDANAPMGDSLWSVQLIRTAIAKATRGQS
jgi:hypothetical protein